MPLVQDRAASAQASATRPLVLWHLLSLDAPTVAALWTWFIARTAHVALPLASVAAMFLAVWILYAADRLLDVRNSDLRDPDTRHIHTRHPDLEARHLFHLRYRRLFRIGVVLAVTSLAPLLLALPPEALRLYLVAGSLLVGWFVLIHAVPAPTSPRRHPHRLPKELAVGVFFAAATFIPTVARAPGLRLILLVPALLFAALCSLNCLFIYAWEHPHPAYPHSIRNDCHPTTRFALAHMPVLTIALVVAAAATAVLDQAARPLTLAIAVAAALLLVLDHLRPLSRTALRAAADLALLTPIFFLL